MALMGHAMSSGVQVLQAESKDPIGCVEQRKGPCKSYCIICWSVYSTIVLRTAGLMGAAILFFLLLALASLKSIKILRILVVLLIYRQTFFSKHAVDTWVHQAPPCMRIGSGAAGSAAIALMLTSRAAS
ncbi:hypothetical protein NDU88_001568 [Pleurodeles waltl]|uniref:Uncharacterized protein n=1 Tax=Pleurodeles waltl TaxID=8319 RepID=A0AAV7KPX2_PLEWA|nr:hypothetical protein NDU88_001568 [Pleurodeles waltl]